MLQKGGAVDILWNAIDGMCDQYESIQPLLKSKFNKHTIGTWRMDVNINDKE